MLKHHFGVASLAALFAFPLCAQDQKSTSADVETQTLRAPSSVAQLTLKYGAFDPTVELPAVPADLEAGHDVNLFVVQFDRAPTQADRDAVLATGAEIHSYLPHNAYVVRMGAAAAEQVEAGDRVRFVGKYQPAWRLEPFLLQEHALNGPAPQRDYNIVVVNKRTDKPALARKIRALGGLVVDEQDIGLLMTVRLTGQQLIKAAHLDEVLWIDRWTPAELDMDNARIQGGGNYVESNLGFTGQGVIGHVYEGVEGTHPDFTTTMLNVSSGGGADTHGHATAGIVFGNGSSNPAVRGMAPDAVGFFTQYSSAIGSRNSIINTVVNTHHGMFTTASWGGSRTRSYTSTSADSDDVIFDHRIPWTQSQSNAGNQDSRPQAWAKNIFSIGGVAHRNNSSAGDDSWAAGNGSTGPASDGRIKPDLCAYYDGIGTSDRTGSAGYSGGNWTSSFGGTSGATPIVAGHNAIAIQMFAAGLFGNAPRVAGGTTFQNRPYAQTLKALMVAGAEQYSFNSGSGDNRREHCGWGFPSLRNLYDSVGRMLVIPEDAPITQGQTHLYNVTVQPGEPELKVSMTFLDPAGNPASALARINDLTLRVTAPNGTVYYGNNGLTSGNYSSPGGSANTIDTVENVFVQNPMSGAWTVEVIATLIAQDANVATGTVDATYALVAVGVNGSGMLPRFSTYGAGCGPVSAATLPGTFYEQFGSFDLANTSVLFSPNGSGGWDVTSCGPCFDNSFSNGLNLGDDQLSRNHALGFAFPLSGGGSTTAIDIDSNGWIGLVANQHSGSDYTESVLEYLGDPARIAAFWDDLNPSANGDVYFDTIPGRAMVTWSNVPEYSNVGSNTMQLQLFPNGDFILAYGNVSSGDGIVGYSRGNGASDPGNGDISSPSGGTPISIGSSGPPRIGTSIALSISNLPSPTSAAVVQVGFTQMAIDLSSFGMTGCSLLTAFDLPLPTGIIGSTATATFNIPNNSGLLGVVAYCQGAIIAPGANPFGVLTTNGGEVTFGN